MNQEGRNRESERGDPFRRLATASGAVFLRLPLLNVHQRRFYHLTLRPRITHIATGIGRSAFYFSQLQGGFSLLREIL